MEWPSFGTLAADADAPLQSDAHLTAFKLKDLLPRLVFPPPHATSSPIKQETWSRSASRKAPPHEQAGRALGADRFRGLGASADFPANTSSSPTGPYRC